METNNLQQVENLIKQIIDLLEKEYKLLKSQGYNIQNPNDISQGLIRLKSGIYTPFESVGYRIMLDHYEIFVLESFILLLKNIYENKDSPFIAFSLRTIQEIGITFLDILFAEDIPSKDKTHIKLLALLSDYAELNDAFLHDFFDKLLQSEKHNLLPKDQKLFNEISGHKKSGNYVLLKEKVRQARWRFSKTMLKFHKNIKHTTFLGMPNLSTFYSWQSHFLHGNPFLLNNVFNKRMYKKGKLKAYAILLIVGLNAATRITTYLKNQSLIAELKLLEKKFEELWPDFIRSYK